MRHDEDFGQTLGKWGVGSGPYLVLPFMGPTDLRDGSMLALDGTVNPESGERHLDEYRSIRPGKKSISARI